MMLGISTIQTLANSVMKDNTRNIFFHLEFVEKKILTWPTDKKITVSLKTEEVLV